MSRDLVAMLEYEAKRKPLVGELWDRLPDLTDEEIDAAPLPLAWFRKAFRLARERKLAGVARDMIGEIAAANPIDPRDVEAGANATKGWASEYLGDTGFFKSSTGFECEVKHSTWLFFPDDGGVWDYQTFFDHIPKAFEQRRDIEYQTRFEYVLAWADELRRRY